MKLLKRTALVILSLLLVFALASCGDGVNYTEELLNYVSETNHDITIDFLKENIPDSYDVTINPVVTDNTLTNATTGVYYVGDNSYAFVYVTDTNEFYTEQTFNAVKEKIQENFIADNGLDGQDVDIGFTVSNIDVSYLSFKGTFDESKADQIQKEDGTIYIANILPWTEDEAEIQKLVDKYSKEALNINIKAGKVDEYVKENNIESLELIKNNPNAVIWLIDNLEEYEVGDTVWYKLSKDGDTYKLERRYSTSENTFESEIVKEEK